MILNNCSWTASCGTGAQAWGMYINAGIDIQRNSQWVFQNSSVKIQGSVGAIFLALQRGAFSVSQNSSFTAQHVSFDVTGAVGGANMVYGVTFGTAMAIESKSTVLFNKASGTVRYGVPHSVVFLKSQPVRVVGSSQLLFQYCTLTSVATTTTFSVVKTVATLFTIKDFSRFVFERCTLTGTGGGVVHGFREQASLYDVSVWSEVAIRWCTIIITCKMSTGYSRGNGNYPATFTKNSIFAFEYNYWKSTQNNGGSSKSQSLYFDTPMIFKSGSQLRFISNRIHTLAKHTICSNWTPRGIRFLRPCTFQGLGAIVASYNEFICRSSTNYIPFQAKNFDWRSIGSRVIRMKCNKPSSLGNPNGGDISYYTGGCGTCSKLDNCNPASTYTTGVTGTDSMWTEACTCQCNLALRNDATDPPYDQHCNLHPMWQTKGFGVLNDSSTPYPPVLTSFRLPLPGTSSPSLTVSSTRSEVTASKSRTDTKTESQTESFSPTNSRTGHTPSDSMSISLTASDRSHSKSPSLSRTLTPSERTSTGSYSKSSTVSSSATLSGSYSPSRTLTITQPPSSTVNRHDSRTLTATSPSVSKTQPTMSKTQGTVTISHPVIYLFSSNSSTAAGGSKGISTDALLQNPRIIPLHRPNVTGIRLVIQLNDDIFTIEPGVNQVPTTKSWPAHCMIYDAFFVAFHDYFRQTPPNVTVLNQSAIALDFLFAELNTSALLRSVMKNDTITIRVNSSCHYQGTELNPLEFLFLAGSPLPPRRVSPLPEDLVTAQTSTDITKIVAATAGAGMVAVQSARSTVLLRMQTCEPDFNETLDWMSNPFQQSISPYPYKEFLGCALFNQILMVAIPGFQALGGALEAIAHKKPIRKGFVWIRFPSLAVLPLMYLVEPTCYGAVVVILYSEETWHTVAAIASLVVSYALVASIFVHLRRSWAGRMVPGQRPERASRRKMVEVRDDDLPVYEPWLLTKRRRILLSVAYWIDGGVSWKDKPGHKGYCRSNRLLFMDYRGEWYWFLAVEMGVATVLGSLGGIQMGSNRCTETTFVVIVCLLGFLVAIAVLRPDNAPFLGMFSVFVTFLQLFASCFTVAHMIGGQEQYEELANGVLAVTFYLIIARTFFDILPKFLAILRSTAGWMRQKAEAINNTFEDHLLAVAQEQEIDQELEVRQTGGEQQASSEERGSFSEALENMSLASSHSDLRERLLHTPVEHHVLGEGAALVMDRLEWDPEEFQEPVPPPRGADSDNPRYRTEILRCRIGNQLNESLDEADEEDQRTVPSRTSSDLSQLSLLLGNRPLQSNGEGAPLVLDPPEDLSLLGLAPEIVPAATRSVEEENEGGLPKAQLRSDLLRSFEERPPSSTGSSDDDESSDEDSRFGPANVMQNPMRRATDTAALKGLGYRHL